jgi:succinate dehydrogenase / fumarate reductase flavoprotein subunit
MGNSLLDVIVFGRDAGIAAAQKSKTVEVGELSLKHVDDFASELEVAGIHPTKLSPQILPDYARKQK